MKIFSKIKKNTVTYKPIIKNQNGGNRWQFKGGKWIALTDDAGIGLKAGDTAKQGTIGQDRNGNYNIFFNGKWVKDGQKFTNSDGSTSTWNSKLRRFVRTGATKAKWNNDTQSWGESIYDIPVLNKKELTPGNIIQLQKLVGATPDGRFGKATRDALTRKFGEYTGDNPNGWSAWSEKWSTDDPKYNSIYTSLGWNKSGKNIILITRKYNELPDAAYGLFNIHNVRLVKQGNNNYYQADKGNTNNIFMHIKNLSQGMELGDDDIIRDNVSHLPIGFVVNKEYYVIPQQVQQ